MSTQDDLFHPIVPLPEPVRQARYDRLVGLDEIKERLRKEAAVLAAPATLQDWVRKHHAGADDTLQVMRDRAPLILFGGDVGTGKSALAESFGCDLSTYLRIPVQLYRLKLTARGSGLVGEMTNLIGEAFDLVRREAEISQRGTTISAIQIFVVDEADAVVQSRDGLQMHHEDRAGVDAFLAGIDSLAGAGLPIIVVLCTNRLCALDPAIKRRAAAIFEFGRPDDDRRREVLAASLKPLGLSRQTVEALVEITGPIGDGQPGFTYSDLTQRLVPSIILEAYPDRAVDGELALGVARALSATPVFNETGAL